MIPPPPPPPPVAGPVARTRNTSVSQLETFDLCPRKWWLFRVARLKEPQKHHFKVGTALHDVAERYLTGSKELYPSGWDAELHEFESHWIQQMAAEAIAQGLWSYTPGSQVEWPLSMLVGDEHRDRRGLPLVGKSQIRTTEEGIRVVEAPTALVDGSPLPAKWDRLPFLAGFIDFMTLQPPRVRDHKTAKNRRYGKKRSDITESTQMLVYSCLPFTLDPNLMQVDAGYNVFLKDEAAANPVYEVSDIITVDQAAARWDTVIKMVTATEYFRESAPRVGDDKNDQRAANWRQVPGAIDTYRGDPKQIKERCDAFGGCPFRDLCFGRCSHDQLTRRMDNDLISKQRYESSPFIKSFGLLPSKENHMPFVPTKAPAWSVGQTVYVPEPENTTDIYTGRVIAVEGDGLTIAFRPLADIEPNWDTLPEIYRAAIPIDQCLVVPAPGRTIKSYAEALTAAGHEAPPWEPLQVEPATQPPPPPAATEEPAKDYGLLPPPPPAPVAAPADEGQQLIPGTEPHSIQQVIESHKRWVGSNIHIKSQGDRNSFRGLCEAVDEEGIHIQGFGAPISWDQVNQITEMSKEPIPGDEKDKKRVEKERQHEAMGVADVVESLRALVAKGMAKNSPSIGKRDLGKVEELLDLLEQKLTEQRTQGPVAVDANGNPELTPEQAYHLGAEDLYVQVMGAIGPLDPRA